jgi:hypothetical protein
LSWKARKVHGGFGAAPPYPGYDIGLTADYVFQFAEKQPLIE